VRVFFFRVFDRAGNSRLSSKVLLMRDVDGITIDSFVFARKIVLGCGRPGFVFKVKGAAAASIDHGAGSIAYEHHAGSLRPRDFFPSRRCRAALYTSPPPIPTRRHQDGDLHLRRRHDGAGRSSSSARRPV
jgi:hypothetical protein